MLPPKLPHFKLDGEQQLLNTMELTLELGKGSVYLLFEPRLHLCRTVRSAVRFGFNECAIQVAEDLDTLRYN